MLWRQMPHSLEKSFSNPSIVLTYGLQRGRDALNPRTVSALHFVTEELENTKTTSK